MMKLTPIIVFLFMVFVASSQTDSANCTVKQAGNFRIELAGCHYYLDLYIYDSKGKPLRNHRVTGYVEFCYLDETALTSKITQFFHTHSLRAKIPIEGFYNCKVTLWVDGTELSTYFDNECSLK